MFTDFDGKNASGPARKVAAGHYFVLRARVAREERDDARAVLAFDFARFAFALEVGRAELAFVERRAVVLGEDFRVFAD